ncbi:MAG: YceI family protein [Bacteroidota bacterium]
MKVKISGSIIYFLLISTLSVNAQILITNHSSVSFFSDGLLEDISATNSDAKGALNLATGEFLFRIPITSFHFENNLMQEHFNENYMESEKYPYATFKGKMSKDHLTQIDSTEQTISVEGMLTIHGIEKDRTIPVKFHNDKNGLVANSTFMVVLADHEIDIPTIVFQKIAEQVEVTVDISLAEKSNSL